MALVSVIEALAALALATWAALRLIRIVRGNWPPIRLATVENAKSLLWPSLLLSLVLSWWVR